MVSWRKIVRSLVVPVVIIFSAVILLFWQLDFVNREFDPKFGRMDATGFFIGPAKTFTYFYYYLNLFPLRTTLNNLSFNRQGALDILKFHKDTLQMENSNYISWGDNFKSVILLIDAKIKGGSEFADSHLFNISFFVGSLVLLLFSFYLIRQPLLGIILILLLGSNPFQLYEVYTNDNIFGLNITLLIFSLALTLPLFVPKKIRVLPIILICITIGLVLGTIAHVRLESTVIFFSVVGVMMALPNTKLALRLIFIATLVLSVFMTAKSWERYFDFKFDEVQRVLSQRFPTKRMYHSIWHPVFSGLGDFDKKYGYKWDDIKSYRYAEPYLRELNPEKYNSLPSFESWSVQPEYQAIIRAKVINDITHDPLWYLDILNQRLNRIFSDVSPISLQIGSFSLYLSKVGWIYLPVLFFFILKRDTFRVKLLLFPLSISLVILLVYSSRGITNLSVFHIFAFAVLSEYLISGIISHAKTKYCTSPI